MHSSTLGSGASNVLCKYFKQGNCARGSSCYFSHDRRSENVCRYYLQNACAYGDRCRYDHVRPSALQTNMTSFNGAPSSISFSASSTPSVPSSSFVPWNKIAAGKATSSDVPTNQLSVPADEDPGSLALCPYGVRDGTCGVPDCHLLHGDVCDVCQLMILHPFNSQLRDEHKMLCQRKFEEDLHYSFAIEASKDKVCGICLEVVLEKEVPSERKFGIMDCCDHVFCLKCIMSWRQTGPEVMAKEAIKSCPECRRNALFIMKSNYWCDTPEAKQMLMDRWMENAKKKPCKFWKSEGFCLHAEKCFFSHDGSPGQRRRRLENDRGVFLDLEHQIDFVTMLLEATRRRTNINASSLLFSLSDDDSDDSSAESRSHSERVAGSSLLQAAELERFGDLSLDETDSSVDSEWTTEEDDGDELFSPDESNAVN